MRKAIPLQTDVLAEIEDLRIDLKKLKDLQQGTTDAEIPQRTKTIRFAVQQARPLVKREIDRLEQEIREHGPKIRIA